MNFIPLKSACRAGEIVQQTGCFVLHAHNLTSISWNPYGPVSITRSNPEHAGCGPTPNQKKKKYACLLLMGSKTLSWQTSHWKDAVFSLLLALWAGFLSIFRNEGQGVSKSINCCLKQLFNYILILEGLRDHTSRSQRSLLEVLKGTIGNIGD